MASEYDNDLLIDMGRLHRNLSANANNDCDCFSLEHITMEESNLMIPLSSMVYFMFESLSINI